MEKLFHEGKLFQNLMYSGKETKNREFEKCTFNHCDFSNGAFTSCKFIDCSFNNCNLTMTKLNHTQLNNINFNDCKLLGVNFSNTNDFLFDVNFETCVLDYAIFLKKKMPKTIFNKTSIKNADFTECDLTKSIFSEADLMNTVFYKSNLKEANFLTAFNYNIDPDLNNIRKAKFSLLEISGLLGKYDIIIE